MSFPEQSKNMTDKNLAFNQDGQFIERKKMKIIT